MSTNTYIPAIPIELEGPDKVGKGIIAKYLGIIGNYKYIINERGVLSQLVYNDKFKRNYNYTLTYLPIIVLLDVGEIDHKIRCRLNNEPTINIQKDRLVFDTYANELNASGVLVLKYNTTVQTPYEIAVSIDKIVSEYMDTTLSKYTDIAALLDNINIRNLNMYNDTDLECEDVYYNNIFEE